ncbi:hypothetical protein D5S17_04295 [Pseudonocardiaceae bacterium YIM PH 21723]|nr:hypothetical protein D5S17_04295 [Pseudonocardiaceae bacterium YIM PH 21723]
MQRFHETQQAYWEWQDQVSALWDEAGSLHPEEPHLSARMDQLMAGLNHAGGFSLLHTLWNGWAHLNWDVGTFDGDPDELVHYSLRYLEWEAHYPDEWCRHWGTKASLLGSLAHRDLSGPHRARLADLVLLAVGREHRCEDGRYTRLARVIADDDLRDRIAMQEASTDPLIALRAGFLMYLLDNPEVPATPRTWRTWLG